MHVKKQYNVIEINSTVVVIIKVGNQTFLRYPYHVIKVYHNIVEIQPSVSVDVLIVPIVVRIKRK